jgi:Golgi phosphoprotein 3
LRRRRASPEPFRKAEDDDDEGDKLMNSEHSREYIIGISQGLSSAAGARDGKNGPHLTLMDEVILLGLRDQTGYLSFMNDSISYVLRGCILMELGLIGRIRTERSPTRGPGFSERVVRIIDASPTDDVLLDETIRILKREEHSIGGWLDLLAGETWNPLKSYLQIKNVRERVAKGLVEKGILRTDKQSFVLFEMATHPLASRTTKNDLCKRIIGTCLGRGPVPTLRSVTLVASALSANLIDCALKPLTMSERTAAINRAEELLRLYAGPSERSGPLPHANSVIAGVLSVFTRLDTLIY